MGNSKGAGRRGGRGGQIDNPPADPQARKLKFRPTKVIFAASDSDYRILRGISLLDGAQICVTGYLGIEVGLDVEVQGAWTKHKTYGYQFEASGILGASGQPAGPKALLLDLMHRSIQTLPQGTREAINRLNRDTAAAALQNPYSLLGVWPRMLWQDADQMAMKVGLAELGPERLGAAFSYLFRRWGGQMAGHEAHTASTWAPFNAVLAEIGRLLQVDRQALETAMADSRQTTAMAILDPEPGVILRSIAEAEDSILFDIQRLQASNGPDIGWPSLTGFSLSPEQADAVLVSSNQSISAIYGPPGTGKTTAILALAQIHRSLPVYAKRVHTILCAPTGKAVDRLREVVGNAMPDSGLPIMTIHSMLEAEMQGGQFIFTRNRENPILGQPFLLVIDEASMVDTELLAAVLEALPDGSRVVLIGDINQIRPVGPGQPFKDLILSKAILGNQLTRIFRQTTGSAIAEACGLVLGGEPHRLFQFLRSREAALEIEYIPIVEDSEIPNRILGFDTKKTFYSDIILTPMNVGKAGAIELNLAVQRWLRGASGTPWMTTARGMDIYHLDKVMQIRNDYKRRDGIGIFNGEIGTVVGMRGGRIEVEFPRAGRHGHETYTAAEAGASLQLAYAISIHKSQGSEWDRVTMVIPAESSGFVTRELLYTGMSRAKNRLTIFASVQAIQRALAEAPIQANTRLAWLLCRQTAAPISKPEI